MASKNDYDLLETTVDTGAEINLDPSAEIAAVIDDLESLLKNGEVIGKLTTAGINASLALVAIDGLRHYLAGEKASAADDFGTVAEEIRARLVLAAEAGGEA
ncbi:MAG: hypothetical protein ABI193_22740 [Minicystis sp.]